MDILFVLQALSFLATSCTERLTMSEYACWNFSEDEKQYRETFNAIARDRNDDARERAWRRLLDARRHALRQLALKGRGVPLVMLRHAAQPRLLGAAVIDDLSGARAGRISIDGSAQEAILATVRCDFRFDFAPSLDRPEAERPDVEEQLPPCELPGACPHDVDVLVRESDNQSDRTVGGMNALRERLGS